MGSILRTAAERLRPIAARIAFEEGCLPIHIRHDSDPTVMAVGTIAENGEHIAVRLSSTDRDEVRSAILELKRWATE